MESSQQDAQPRAVNRKHFIILILLASTFTVMAGALVSPALPAIANHFHDVPDIREIWAPMIMTVPSGASAVISLFIGAIVDRFGRQRVLSISLCSYAIAGSSGAYLENIFAILAMRLLLGASVSGIITSIMTSLGDFFEDKQQQRKFLSLQSMFMQIGGVAFLVASGGIANLSWRAPFFVYLASLTCVPSSFMVIKNPSFVQQVRDRRITTKIPKSVILKSLGIYVTGFVTMIVFYQFPTQLPFYLKNLGLEAKDSLLISTYVGMASVGGVITSFFFPRIKKLLPDRDFIMFAVSFTIMLPGLLILGLAGTLVTVYIAALLIGFGFGMVAPEVTSSIMAIAPETHRGRFVGLVNFSIFTGAFVCPFVALPILSVANRVSLFWIVSIPIAFMAVLYWTLFLTDTKRRVEPDDAIEIGVVEAVRRASVSPST